MKKLLVMAVALILGLFVLTAGKSPVYASAASVTLGAIQTEALKDSQATQVWWRGGYGWHGYGWRGRYWGPGVAFYGPGWGWGGPYYYGPYCRWHCGPYRCWRACW